ncbi:TRAP transporter [Bacillaceae bacterium JMAK1]|nr:TRAP transporter [Bacillaceae bacterium JMAK1]
MNKYKKVLLSGTFLSVAVLAACDSDIDVDELDEDDLNVGDTDGADDGDDADGEDAASSGDGSQLQIGTGSTGGTYYALGQEMANVISDNADGVTVNAVSTGASNENIARVHNGDLDLGMTVHIPALDALEGIGDFEGQGEFDQFGYMGYIYPETNQIAVRADSGIESIEDLEGMRVNLGPPNSASQSASLMILEAYGMTEDDIEVYEEGFGDGAGMLQDGNIDATFGLLGLPADNITELDSQIDVELLSIDEDALDTIEENSMYERIVIPADTYDFLEEDINAIAAYAVLIGSNETIDEDLGYEITKALYENASSITHNQGMHMEDTDNLLLGNEGLPMHPGAERYFEEAGLLN